MQNGKTAVVGSLKMAKIIDTIIAAKKL